MASFSYLWSWCKEFRQLFVSNGIFKSPAQYDVAIAEALWLQRFPLIEFGTCNNRHKVSPLNKNCFALVEEGSPCFKHSRMMPVYKWVDGVLYKYDSTKKEYVVFIDIVMEGIYKRSKNDMVIFRDNNPFNMHKDNMLFVLKYTATLMNEYKLSFRDTLKLDIELRDRCGFLYNRGGDHNMKNFMYYTIETIAKACDRLPSTVLASQVNGVFDISDLRSVSEYICRAISNKEKK